MRLRFALLALIAFVAALPVCSAFGLTANPADRLADLPIDDYAYDKARECRKKPTPGALALVHWLERNAEGTSWGIMRCERWGTNSASLHSEGRAVEAVRGAQADLFLGAVGPRVLPARARRA